MKPRKHAITPTDAAPQPNPDWRYSPPRNLRIRVDPCDPSKGTVEVVEIDAMQLAWADEHSRAAEERNKKLRGWGKGR